MNKLMGFYELKESDLPTVPWQTFENDTVLTSERLWTIRSAVHRGNDLSLPRMVGAKADEAGTFAMNLKRQLGDNGMVIYYPYFCAEKSGTLQVLWNRYVIEAVEADLWNLVTESKCDVTIDADGENIKISGDKEFFKEEELEVLRKQVPAVKRMFRDELLEGKSVLLEWSFAYDCGSDKTRIGNPYLVFYEVRTVN